MRVLRKKPIYLRAAYLIFAIVPGHCIAAIADGADPFGLMVIISSDVVRCLRTNRRSSSQCRDENSTIELNLTLTRPNDVTAQVDERTLGRGYQWRGCQRQAMLNVTRRNTIPGESR
jgi:hypothetical protein